MLQTANLLQRDFKHVAHIDKPSFLLNVPFSLSTDVPNNIWMVELNPDERMINKNKAIEQFMSLYSFLTRYAIVYLLPSYPELQDQTYVANLGIVLPHTEEKTVVISNFRSEPRQGESAIGREFFKLMQFSIIDAPPYFEGEADLKYIRDNLYIGAHGIRTSKEALDWFSESFDMKVIPFFMPDKYLYHLDCCVFPITSECVAICTKIAGKETVRELEKYVDIYDVSVDDAYSGFNNSVVLGNYILCASDIDELSPSDKNYQIEKSKNESLNSLCSSIGMEPVFFNLSEFCKSGALLSCLIMHLNRNNSCKSIDDLHLQHISGR
jgi:N-dimethylarginine dimethylaminohydrolase